MSLLVTRPVAWIVRWLGVRTLITLALLLIALVCVALGLADLIRGLDAGLLLPIAVAGMLVGWLLARSLLPGWLAGVLAAALGAAAVLIRVGRLGRSLTALLGSLGELAWEFLRWPLDGSAPDTSSIPPALAELEKGTSTLLTHLREWSTAVTGGQAAWDPVATAFVWGLVLWMAAVWASWAVRRRHQPLQGIAPAGTVLAIALSYAWANPYLLWILLGATLLLLAVSGQVVREGRWEIAGIDFSPELRLDLALVAVPLSLALMAAAILAPSISARPVVKFAQRLFVEHLSGGKQVADSMGLEPLAGPGVALDQIRAAGLPNRGLIGSGPELSEQEVMVIHLEEYAPAAETLSSLLDTGPRYYWRAVTYDDYNGRGWRTDETKKVSYRAGERATFQTEFEEQAWINPDVHRTLRQEIQVVADLGGILYRAGELVTADQDYRVAWRSPGDVFGAEIDAQVYRVDSLVPVVSEAQLRAARNDYPQSIRDRYLVLPLLVPARVRSLAYDLTASEPTAYDKARAIETYLRTLPYTLDLPAPPPNRELADYFLFDLRRGFCDYYATTMVVLARAAGLPARLVSGYIGGTYDEADARYVVSAADAHSWVEIYFPGYGWIEFEPTGGRPAIVRPAATFPVDLSEPQTPLKPRKSGRLAPDRILWLGVLGGLVSLGLGGLAWWLTDGWRLRRLPPAAAVGTLYHRLYRHGRRLALPMEAGETPYEFAAGLTGHITQLAQERDADADSSPISREVRWLTELYVRSLYSPHKANASEQAQAIRAWQRLRRHLWRAWVWQKWRRS